MEGRLPILNKKWIFPVDNRKRLIPRWVRNIVGLATGDQVQILVTGIHAVELEPGDIVVGKAR